MLLMKTVKRWRLWSYFWVLYDLGFFAKNMLEADYATAIVFGVLALIMVSTYYIGLPGAERTEQRELSARFDDE